MLRRIRKLVENENATTVIEFAVVATLIATAGIFALSHAAG